MPSTARLVLRHVTVDDAEDFLEYYRRNDEYLQPWEPIKEDNFFTLEFQRDLLERHVKAKEDGTMHVFAIFPKDDPDRLVGRIAIDSIARGALQGANIGYSIDESCAGRGYATEAVEAVEEYAFATLELHRLAAGTMLSNAASQRVLEKAGFRREGLALRFLNINGAWEDHYLFAKTIEEWRS